jgi:hypothetical protein
MAYGRPVRRSLNRLARPVALLVIAAQWLLGFSAMAGAQSAVASATHAPCDEMAAAHHNDGCPCCPDEAGSMKDCLVMCTLAAAVAPSVFVVAVTPSHAVSFVEFSDYLSSLSDPPLKPPPIA